MIDQDDHGRAIELMQRARLLRDAGRYPEAIEMCQASIAADPTFWVPYAVIATIELILADADRYSTSGGEDHARTACDAAGRAVSLAPESSWALGLLARSAGALNDHATSVSAGLKAVALAPESASAHLSLSYAYKKAGEFDQALAAAQEAVRVAPNERETYKTLARIHIQRREWAEAEAALRKALSLKPEDDEALNDLHIAVKHQGRLEEAVSILETAARLNPTRPETRLNVLVTRRSDASEHLSQASTTIADAWWQARDVDPGEPLGREWLDRARPHIRSNPDLAQSIIDELRALRPAGHPTVLKGDALLAVGRGEDDAAREILNEIITAVPALRNSLQRDPDLGPLLRPTAS